jgi:DNA-binding winged helix-turn-helix (wHTH) protein
VLFLSARQEDSDKIRGPGARRGRLRREERDAGEIIARIKAVLRRYRRGEDAAAGVLDFGRLVLDLRAHEVRIGGEPVPLTAREFALLQLLAEHPRQVFTRDQLFDRFWGEFGDQHTLTVHIGRLREKIEEDPAHPRYIVTVWGVGYRFEGRAASVSRRERTLPIRRWLVLALGAMFLMPALAGAVVFASYEFDAAGEVARELSADVARWSDPAWQAEARAAYTARGVNFVLFDATGREVYRSTPDPLAPHDDRRFDLSVRRVTVPAGTARICTSSAGPLNGYG